VKGGIPMEAYFEKTKLVEYFSSRKQTNSLGTGKRYQKCFDKRLYLVEFLLIPRLGAHYNNMKTWPLGLHGQIDWRQACAQWNKAHPYDQMRPADLKSRYYHAIAEEGIQQEFLARRYKENETKRLRRAIFRRVYGGT